MKDNGEDHVVHHNIFSDDMIERKMKCAKFGKVDNLKIGPKLCSSNLLQ